MSARSAFEASGHRARSGLQLATPTEPSDVKAAARAQAEDGWDRWVDGLDRPDGVSSHLWARWRTDLVAAGIDQRAFRAVVADYHQELWYWVWGDRTWTQCIEGLAGRLIRRQPSTSSTTTCGGLHNSGHGAGIMTTGHERCEACGFDGGTYNDDQLLEGLRSLGAQWNRLLAEADGQLRARPAPDVWSALEYAAHTRDVLALHVFGVEQALTRDEPAFPPVEDGLADAVAGTYAGEDPRAVGHQLAVEATRLARLAADAGPDSWRRGLTIGEDRSDVRRLLEHALHDASHHEADVERGLLQLRESAT